MGVYVLSVVLLTYAAVTSMCRVRQHLKSNNDVASVYLRRMLTKNLWLTLLANVVSLGRCNWSVVCLTISYQTPADKSEEAEMFEKLMKMALTVFDVVVNGFCVLALSGLLSSSQNEQVLGFFSLAKRLARLGDARKRVLEELGYDLGEKIRELEEPLTHSTLAYGGALQRLFCKEPEAMMKLMHLDSQHLYGGVLRCVGDAPAEEMDSITQRTNDIEVLLRDAQEVQPLLREKIAPQDMWHSPESTCRPNPPRTSTCANPEDINVSPESPEEVEHDENACLVARRIECKEVLMDGILAFADEALDPGVKKPKRVKEKATFKYQDQDGMPQFDRVRDIARMALQFETAEALVRALPAIYDAFEVVEVENRFANPTALGWMDISLLLRMQLASGDAHIAELQAQLNEFADERRRAHRHYKTIRAAIPEMGVRAEHVDAVQLLILDAIEGPAIRRSDQFRQDRAVLDAIEGQPSMNSGRTPSSDPPLDSVVPCQLVGAVAA
jgi:hypothetical protein